MTGHDYLSVPLFTPEGLADILVFALAGLFPLQDFGPTAVSMFFVRHDDILTEALSEFLLVETSVGSEVGSDRFRKIKSRGRIGG